MRILKQQPLRTAVTCDFDGCLCYQDVFDEIMDHFTGTGWRRFGVSYENGEISHSEMIRRAVSFLRCSSHEIDQFLSQKIEIRRGYEEFCTFCKQFGIPLIIVSTGCDYYIEQLLDKGPLYSLRSRGEFGKISTGRVGIIANHLQFSLAKNLWEVSFPWGEEIGCLCQCSPCKGEIIRHLKEFGINFVIGIGDGLSDRCMAHTADLVFARGPLSNYCKTNGIPFHKFNSFRGVTGIIKKYENLI